MSSGRTLRELLTGPRALVVPGVPNALIARVAEETGFPAVFFTGAGCAHLRVGFPGLGVSAGVEEKKSSVAPAGEARRDPDTVIRARTDARQGYGLEEAIGRAIAYAEAGGGGAFFGAPPSGGGVGGGPPRAPRPPE